MLGNIKYTVRNAQKSDLEQLFNMLIELVKHENSFERFKLTRERLEVELFADHADWHCLVAASPKEAIFGFCFYTFANINRAFNLSPMIQVDDLYVSPNFRRLNIGQNLLFHLAQIAQDRKIGRLNVWCVKDNFIGQNFYQKIGAEKRDFIDVYSIEIDKILSNSITLS